MPSHSRDERAALADLMTTLGPDAPTLCGDWTTRDLAAHLVVRERRPDIGIGAVVPGLNRWADRARIGLRDGTPWEELLGLLRAGAPAWSPMGNSRTEPAVNLLEFFVHHEDVRRAQPGWGPRALPSRLEDDLWTRLQLAGPLMTRKWGAGLAVAAPGGRSLRLRRGEPTVTVSGAPSELVLYCTGRQQVARVTSDGPPDLVASLDAAPFGI
ncbi:MAG TPA: TIGR03085 family metal-binding protein [Mycobacteriales bacterium]|nr:TIGR03085 family metal-binding protein [Mycobacteriales bacterium]